jgi:MFS family permease
MGLFEGAYAPAAIVATLEASDPKRHGRNLGIQQAAMPFFGLALAPIIVTQLLQIVRWQSVFSFVAVPGLIVAVLSWLVLRDPSAENLREQTLTHDIRRHQWREVFLYRNVCLNVGIMLCCIIILVVTTAMFPSYLTDYLHIEPSKMGFVLSAIGFGAGVGTIVLPAISDWIGRKPVMIVGALAGVAFITALSFAGPSPVLLFVLLFGTHFCNFGLICLIVGPLSTESVPALLMTTASGIVIGIGEFFGGGIAPILAGYIAQHFGIQQALRFGIAALAGAFLLSFGLNETAPRLMAKRGDAAF